MRLVIGNIFTLIASILMLKQGLIREKDRIIYLQSLQFVFYMIGDAILGGFAGALVNAINILRNVFYYKNKLRKKKIIIMSIFLLIFTIFINKLGVIGYFPSLIFIICAIILKTENIYKIKILMILSLSLWIVYDFKIQAYTSMLFEIFGVITNILFFVKLKYNSR